MKTVTITESSRGTKLQKPLTLLMPEANNIADQKLQPIHYRRSANENAKLSFSSPLKNASTIELAKHLLRHRTGSQQTLYQYIYGVHRFSKWANIQPDQLVKSCQDIDGDPKPKALAPNQSYARRLHSQPPSRRLSTRLNQQPM